jgi:hypothetical protein
MVSGLLFVGGFAISLYRTGGGVRDLADRTFDVLFLYLVLISWWYWPWYLTWLAPAAALGHGWRRPVALAVMSAGSLLTYLYWWPDPVWRSTDWYVAYIAITVGVFVVPVLLWLWPRGRSDETTLHGGSELRDGKRTISRPASYVDRVG